MSRVADEARDASILIAFGLRPRLRPENEPDYGSLLARYRIDADFRSVVEAVAEGLGLLVLGGGPFGLALGPQEGSVFALRLSDYKSSLTVEDRLLHGLVHLAIAAYCYPTAASLDDEAAVQRVSATGIERYLRDVCERLAGRLADVDPRDDQPELEQAWRIYHRRNATRDTGDGRRAPKSTQGIIGHALETLADQGFLRRVSDAEGGTYQALARYRIQVREMAAHEGYRLIVGAARGGEAALASPTQPLGAPNP
jgi:hypothetical protein